MLNLDCMSGLNLFEKTLVFLSFNCFSLVVLSQGVAFNNTGDFSDTSAMLDVNSTNLGVLIPRMTITQRDAILNPAHSLLIFNITTNCFEAYNQDNSEWFAFGCLENPSEFPNSFVHCGAITKIVAVTNPETGKTWMDRNLGASQAATSSTDTSSYGDLYQWGRFADGHQCRTSPTTTILSSTDSPGHGNFIIGMSSPYDWRSPQNVNLWQGVNGINNPCPTGYRIPTVAEWEDERASWSSNNAAGAFASPLKLPMTGYRGRNNGTLYLVEYLGDYWSSAVDGTGSSYLIFGSSTANTSNATNRAQGLTVRCIKD
jgi:hypothetical protein